MSVGQILDTIDEYQLGKSNAWLVTGGPTLLVDSSEYKEGEAAFRRGLTTRNNPYPFLSPEYWRWQEGLLGNGRPREWQANREPYKLEEHCGGEVRLVKPR
jgi:hypothetical protein